MTSLCGALLPRHPARMQCLQGHWQGVVAAQFTSKAPFYSYFLYATLRNISFFMAFFFWFFNFFFRILYALSEWLPAAATATLTCHSPPISCPNTPSILEYACTSSWFGTCILWHVCLPVCLSVCPPQHLLAASLAATSHRKQMQQAMLNQNHALALASKY